MKLHSVLAGAFAAVLLAGCATAQTASTKNIVIIAGKPSHPAGMHEFRAGS
jgi:type IV pilus biogenesis protein CpaD/CtpE